MRKIPNAELGRLSIEAFKRAEKFNFVVVLDNIRSMNNVGSAFRTSDAFKCEKILLCGITARPPHREITKTALGATESVQWEYFPTTLEAVQTLKKQNYIIVAVEQTDVSIQLHQFKPIKNKKYAFIFGHEVKGVSENILPQCDMALEIPQFGTKHSLNVSVSIGIVLWDFVSKIYLSNT